MRVWLIGVSCIATLSACATTSIAQSKPSPATATQPSPSGWSEPACSSSNVAGGEVRGTASTGVEIWGLILGPLPLRVGTDTKVVIRMTGGGEPVIYSDGPSGLQVAPDQGPRVHAGSSWNRPGDEWGTFFTWPSAGCWNIRVLRSPGWGYIPLAVGA